MIQSPEPQIIDLLLDAIDSLREAVEAINNKLRFINRGYVDSTVHDKLIEVSTAITTLDTLIDKLSPQS